MKRRKIVLKASDSAIRNCQSKSWYKTESEALEAAELRMLDNMSVELAVYRCNICTNWHLTRVNNLV